MARRKKQHSPSLETLYTYERFCRVLQDKMTSRSPFSMRTIAGELGISPSDLSRRLDEVELRLKEKYGRKVTLVQRVKGKKLATSLTQEGKRFYGETSRLLEQYEQLTGRRSNPEMREIRIGTTNWLLLNAFFGGLPGQLFNTDVEGRLVFDEAEYFELLHKLQQGQLTLGLGPELEAKEKKEYPYVRFVPLVREIEMALVCPPEHRLAKEFTRKDRKEVQLKELADERLFLVDGRLQPGLGDKLEEHRGGRWVTVSSYGIMLLSVMLHLGIGIVPNRGVIDELCRTSVLCRLPIAGLKIPGISLYLHRQYVYSESEEAVIEAIRGYVEAFWGSTSRNEGPDIDCPFPEDLKGYRSLYYLTWNRACVLEWRKSHVRWDKSKRGGPINGTARDYDGDYAGRVFSIAGELHEHLVHWVAETASQSKPFDRYVASFNAAKPVPADGETLRWYRPPREYHPVLVGTWTGMDDHGMPVTGTALLSRHGLTSKQAVELLQSTNGRMFLESSVPLQRSLLRL